MSKDSKPTVWTMLFNLFSKKDKYTYNEITVYWNVFIANRALMNVEQLVITLNRMNCTSNVIPSINHYLMLDSKIKKGFQKMTFPKEASKDVFIPKVMQYYQCSEIVATRYYNTFIKNNKKLREEIEYHTATEF